MFILPFVLVGGCNLLYTILLGNMTKGKKKRVLENQKSTSKPRL